MYSISSATVKRETIELLDEGFLRSGADTGQRRNTRLWLNGNAGVAMGVELSPDEFRAILTDMGSAPQTTRADSQILGPEGFLDEEVHTLVGGLARRALGLQRTHAQASVFSFR